MTKFLKSNLFIVLFIAFIARITLFLLSYQYGEESFLLFDSYRYLVIGEHFFELGLYAEHITEPLFKSIFAVPGGPFLFYILKSIGGIPMIIIFHIFSQLIICYYLLKIIELLFNKISKKLILISGLLYALDIPSIVMGNVVMTETVFTLFIVLSIYYIIKFIQLDTKMDLLKSSFYLGVSALFRPIIFYFPLFLIVFVILICYKEKQKIGRLLIYILLPFYCVTGVWVARNYYVHEYVFFSYMSNFNLSYYQAATIYSDLYQINLSKARLKFHEELISSFDDPAAVNQIIFYDAAGRKAAGIVISHPKYFLKNMLRAEINLFFRPVRDYLKINLGSKELFHTRSKNHSLTINLITYWQVVINVLMFILFPIGLIYLYRVNYKAFCFFLLFMGYFVLVCCGPEIEARFRVPILPALIVLSLGGILFIKEKLKLKTILQ